MFSLNDNQNIMAPLCLEHSEGYLNTWFFFIQNLSYNLLILKENISVIKKIGSFFCMLVNIINMYP